jgi:hypothetical protein
VLIEPSLSSSPLFELRAAASPLRKRERRISQRILGGMSLTFGSFPLVAACVFALSAVTPNDIEFIMFNVIRTRSLRRGHGPGGVALGIQRNWRQETIDAALADTDGRTRGREKFLLGSTRE